MNTLREIYRHSLALLTDFYELTMAYGYWKSGIADREAVFNLFFRKHPFQGGFSVVCGLGAVIDFLREFHFTDEDVKYLAGLQGNDGQPLFEKAFLDFLRSMKFVCDVDAIAEGAVVFPHEPLVRVRGPIIQCQILESPLLNSINFQTLIATKAARVCLAAQGDPVLEFGLRRAQGIDGSLAASRAAYVGGCAGTSNVLAGKLYGIPVKGTQAHSWIMSFDDEPESFHAYARAMPNNSLFLVDTYDTLDGVRNAVEAGKWLREHGHEMMGIRLDSGDLAYLSVEARKILDEGGFPNAVIVGSNDLDENIIASLKDQGARIGVWGVGTRLATSYDEPAMGGVYKLAAIRDGAGKWQYKIKVSEQALKISTPGILQVRRYSAGDEFIGDMIYDLNNEPEDGCTIVDPMDMTRRKRIPAGSPFTELLSPIFRQGEAVYETPPIGEIRRHAREQLSRFHAGVKRFVNPHQYPVGLEKNLHELKTNLVLRARNAESR